jgi:serine/threonine protein kinase
MSENLDVEIPWPGWRVVSRLGHGTYGSVWEIERDVAGDSERGALKVIGVPPEGEADDSLGLGYDEGTLSATYDERADAVLREYRLMAGLSSHPNVVSCRDFAKIARVAEPGYDVLIRMELLTPLTRWVRGKEIAVRDAARIGRDVARALSACESRGIVHRDVKPENIMVDEWGNFKLGDFGVARTLEGTRTATTAGTETYMAPEVIRHDRYNQTVDIYSLGLVMWWLLDNYRLPFMPAGRLASGDVARAEARRLAGESIPAPAGCPNAFARTVLRACAFRPEDRYQSAAEMVADLDAFLDGKVTTSESVEPIQVSTDPQPDSRDTNWEETGEATIGKEFGAVPGRADEAQAESPEQTVGSGWTGTDRQPERITGQDPMSDYANNNAAMRIDGVATSRVQATPVTDEEASQRDKTSAESFLSGLSAVVGVIWALLVIALFASMVAIKFYPTPSGISLASFDNPSYLVLLSPAVCAAVVYALEGDKRYFKEDFLSFFCKGAYIGSLIFFIGSLTLLFIVFAIAHSNGSDWDSTLAFSFFFVSGLSAALFFGLKTGLELPV